MRAGFYSPDRRVLLSRALALLLIATLAVSREGWHKVAPMFEHCLALAGFALVAVGVMGRIWSASYICGYKNARLIVDGPYSICRNPLYLFSFIGGLGVMLTTETLLFPLLFTGFFWSYYSRVIGREEQAQQKLHGAAFEAYRARVPRFLPDFSLFRESPTHTVSSRHFRRFLMEVVWFVLAASMVEFVEAMHVGEYLPTLLYIY